MFKACCYTGKQQKEVLCDHKGIYYTCPNGRLTENVFKHIPANPNS